MNVLADAFLGIHPEYSLFNARFDRVPIRLAEHQNEEL